jgi:hypothetical protein
LHSLKVADSELIGSKFNQITSLRRQLKLEPNFPGARAARTTFLWDDEMDQIKRYGQALGGGVTPFDEEVELAGYEALYAKLRGRPERGIRQDLGSSGTDEVAG